NADDAVKARANIVIGDNTTDSIAQFIPGLWLYAQIKSVSITA
ncbi:hypothetical protein ACUOA8_62620, partial [Escherichia sp. SS-MK2]